MSACWSSGADEAPASNNGSPVMRPRRPRPKPIGAAASPPPVAPAAEASKRITLRLLMQLLAMGACLVGMALARLELAAVLAVLLGALSWRWLLRPQQPPAAPSAAPRVAARTKSSVASEDTGCEADTSSNDGADNTRLPSRSMNSSRASSLNDEEDDDRLYEDARATFTAARSRV